MTLKNTSFCVKKPSVFSGTIQHPPQSAMLIPVRLKSQFDKFHHKLKDTFQLTTFMIRAFFMAGIYASFCSNCFFNAHKHNSKAPFTITQQSMYILFSMVNHYSISLLKYNAYKRYCQLFLFVIRI